MTGTLSTFLLLACSIAALRTPVVRSAPTAPYRQADSLSLRRFPGALGGPSYEIRLSASGRARIYPDSMRRYFRTGQLRANALDRMLELLVVTGFRELPDTIAGHPVFGRHCGSDGQVVVVTVYYSDRPKHVVDDQHCFWAPAGLRMLESAIENEAGGFSPNLHRPPNER
jgi:hypothetical protein